MASGSSAADRTAHMGRQQLRSAFQKLDLPWRCLDLQKVEVAQRAIDLGIFIEDRHADIALHLSLIHI